MKTPCAKLVLLESQRVLDDMCSGLGLFQSAPVAAAEEEEARLEGTGGAGRGPTRDELIELLLRVRKAAREMKNFELADRIRDGLAALGVRVEDVRDGYRWRPER
jgi:cysteinyl-tRNA synthetase